MPAGRYPNGDKLRPILFGLARLFCLLSFVLSGTLFSGGCDKRQDVESKAAAPAPAEKARRTESAVDPNAIPDCPPAEGPDVFAPREKTEHIVILKWKASVSDAKHADPVGYCLYRSLQGKRQPLQRVNIHPLQRTACTDDLLENSKKYDYKVMAISKKRILSRPSNVAHAEIPKNKPRKHTEEEPPLCRAIEAQR